MIINKFGRVVVPVGETFEYDGDFYRCEAYKKTFPKDVLCDHCSLPPTCDACTSLECCPDGRIDEQHVVFVKVKGGEDERK